MSVTGDAEGKLHVRRQVEDYALRGIEFEEMGFLNFIVETYERPIKNEADHAEETDENVSKRTRQAGYRYLPAHSKSGTHLRHCRAENHNTLPNIVGPWFPRRDGDETTKPFYYASMLALLKPWRDLRRLKGESDDWETMFDKFIQNGNQRNKDVIAGSQYYYESKNVTANRIFDDEKDSDDGELDGENEETDVIDSGEVEPANVTVSFLNKSRSRSFR